MWWDSKWQSESPQSCSSGGFLARYGELFRLDCCCLSSAVQPFAYVVANYTYYDRDKKCGKYFSHRNSPPFCWRFGSLGIISHIFTLQNNFFMFYLSDGMTFEVFRSLLLQACFNVSRSFPPAGFFQCTPADSSQCWRSFLRFSTFHRNGNEHHDKQGIIDAFSILRETL